MTLDSLVETLDRQLLESQNRPANDSLSSLAGALPKKDDYWHSDRYMQQEMLKFKSERSFLAPFFETLIPEN